jgi:hypothetical protein
MPQVLGRRPSDHRAHKLELPFSKVMIVGIIHQIAQQFTAKYR